jgi:alpha-beta hydrolase superfamily lysophospholipase
MGWTAHPRVSVPPLAAPDGALRLRTADGLELFLSLEGPGQPRGVVWYVVGPEVGSTPLYPRLTRALLESQVAVAVFHPRGTGLSPGLRGDLEDEGAFLEDHRTCRAELECRFPGVPVVLFGQSAGAAYALEVAVTSRLPTHGLVLVNAAWKLRATPGMTPTFGQVLTYATNLVLRPSAITVDMNSNPGAVAFGPDREEALAMQADPAVVRYFSMRQLMAQKRVMDRMGASIARCTAPLLVVEGAHDALVDPAGNAELLARATVSDKTKLIAPDGGHGSSAVETQVEPLVAWVLARVTTRRP